MRSMAALLMALTLTPAGSAQELTLSGASYWPFGLNDLDGELPTSAEVRVTIPLSQTFALESLVTAGSRHGRGREGFYGAQIRQRVGRRAPNGYTFVTYGAVGYYSEEGGADPPIIGLVGFGFRYPVSRWLAVRPEIQVVTFHVVPIGARFVAGVSVSLRP
jgi:hypothetical protein